MANDTINPQKLPKGVKVDPANPKQYIISETAAKGETFLGTGGDRKKYITNEDGETVLVSVNNVTVAANTQAQLNTYVASYQSGTATTVNVTNKATGNKTKQKFDPAAINTDKNALNAVQADKARFKKAGITPNADGSYSDSKTGKKLTFAQATAKLKKVGINPTLLTTNNVNNRPSKAVLTDSEKQIRDTITIPSGLSNTTAILAVTGTTTNESDAETARLAIQNQKLVSAAADVGTGYTATAEENAQFFETARGIQAELLNARSQATQQDTVNFQQEADWRVKLSLAPGATCLYKDPQAYLFESILLPLLQTDGVVFPYTPAISVSYNASYAATDVTHSNYNIYSYTSSKVSEITIGCDFTAQDMFEANYLLAVIHFFRSATKMFYGQDENPRNGTPPPLCYLTGLGAFQFDQHPLAIKDFTYTLPTDVDYIRAGVPTTDAGVNKASFTTKQNSGSVSGDRAANNGLSPGGGSAPPKFNVNYSSKTPTYVPTKIALSITAVPIVTRNDISNHFSVKDYATGDLLRGSRRPRGGGFW